MYGTPAATPSGKARSSRKIPASSPTIAAGTAARARDGGRSDSAG